MNVRLTALLLVVLLIFGGTFLVVRFTKSEPNLPDRPWMYKVSDDDIIRISVAFGGKTVSYNKKPGSEKWFIEGTPEVQVVQEKWSGTPLLLSGPQVSRVLATTIDKPAAYGLDPPATKVVVQVRGGLSYEFHMGNPTPDGQNQYARLVGDPALFTVPEIWARVINKLATDPPYPPVGDATGAPGGG
ncbi:MAG: DUF4340 domain-containing protein [SAR202 cluster bacterium]|nr:DUF4340 domain-containing protein [SAR202 cluster bacterium]